MLAATSSSVLERLLAKTSTASPAEPDRGRGWPKRWFLRPGGSDSVAVAELDVQNGKVRVREDNGRVYTDTVQPGDVGVDDLLARMEAKPESQEAPTLTATIIEIWRELASLGWDKVKALEGSRVTLVAKDVDDIEYVVAVDASSKKVTHCPDLPATAVEVIEAGLRRGGCKGALLALEKCIRRCSATLAALRQMDGDAWVVDPEQPSGRHLYRRLILTASVSILVTLDDPLEQLGGLEDEEEWPAELTASKLQLFGPEEASAAFRARLELDAERQQPILADVQDNGGLLRALESVLGIELPHPDDVQEEGDFNVECCICYSIHLRED